MKKILSNKAFTLIELLVVISIIGMLSSVVMASLSSAREKGRIGALIKFDTYNYRKLGADSIAKYSFNDLTDSSGNGLTLTLGNGAVIDTSNSPSGTGSSLFFPSNATGYAVHTLINPTSLTGTASKGFTISLWLKPSVSGSKEVIWIRGAGLSFRISCQAGTLQISRGASLLQYYSSNSCVDVNKWHHITYSFNEISDTGELYEDGKLVSNFTDGSLSYIGLYITEFYIGYRVAYNANWQGNIDEVNIYSEALTAMEIQHLYAQGLEKLKIAGNVGNTK